MSRLAGVKKLINWIKKKEKQYEYDLLIEKSDINKHFGKYKFEKMSDLETFFECEIIK
jgi:hypothetical protein